MKIWFPSLERHGWTLVSAEEQHRQHPSFWIPERRVRETLAVGSLAKLLFEIAVDDVEGPSCEIERMWVLVVARIDGVYRGILDNEPIFADPRTLARGSEVFFGPEHVIAVADMPSTLWTNGLGTTMGQA